MCDFAGVIEVKKQRRRPQGELERAFAPIGPGSSFLRAGDVDEQVYVLLKLQERLERRGDVNLHPAPPAPPLCAGCEVHSAVDPGTQLTLVGALLPLDTQVAHGVDRRGTVMVKIVQQGRLQELFFSSHLIKAVGKILHKALWRRI